VDNLAQHTLYIEILSTRGYRQRWLLPPWCNFLAWDTKLSRDNLYLAQRKRYYLENDNNLSLRDYYRHLHICYNIEIVDGHSGGYYSDDSNTSNVECWSEFFLITCTARIIFASSDCYPDFLLEFTQLFVFNPST